MTSVAIRPQRVLGSALAVLLLGCGAAGPPGGRSISAAVPSPLSLVVIVARTAIHLTQIVRVIEDHATPRETLVVTLPATAPVVATYVVRAGDSLSSIAAAEHVPVADVEVANPQFGPRAGRDWNVIHPGEHVTIPGVRTGQPAAYPVVTRAPAGPPPPSLVPLPERPANPTPFQLAQYEHAVHAAEITNQARLEAWHAAADRSVAGWQREAATAVDAVAGGLAQPGAVASGDPLTITTAATTLAGLPGRRVLLLLDGDIVGPPASALPAGSLVGTELVVANVPDAGQSAAWTTAAAAAGGSVTTLDPALTDLRLPAVVNGRDVSGGGGGER